MEYTEIKNTLISNPAISFWFKEAVKELEKRDICDCLGDIEALHALFTLKMKEMLPTLNPSPFENILFPLDE